MSGPAIPRRLTAVLVLTVMLAPGLNRPWRAQDSTAARDVSEGDLERAGAGRVVQLGAVSAGGHVTAVPLEVYVSRVIAGEAEPDAPDATQQALAIAVRTFAIANAGRHRRDGFDLCDTTHCQVPRPSTPATRRAALATAGRVLTYNGSPAEVFYSASCGGRSENASDVWPGANFPYLRSVVDDVHDEDAPWTLDLTLQQIRAALERAGFAGARLTDVVVEARTGSGRAARLRLAGLRPDVIAGDAFRAAIGARVLRSTAFTIQRQGQSVRFIGRGYGHGVGMCVVGAARRARRGENVDAILHAYYPGLVIEPLSGAAASPAAAATPPRRDAAGAPVPRVPGSAPAERSERSATTLTVSALASPAALMSAGELEERAAAAQREMAALLAVPASPVTVVLHDTVDAFRRATARPWWVSTAVTGTTIDIAPSAFVTGRDESLDVTLRSALAQVLMGSALADRPLWVRVGGARYFARQRPAAGGPPPAAAVAREASCPADAELTLSISAAAQRAAEARAEACFARAYGRIKDWRQVR